MKKFPIRPETFYEVTSLVVALVCLAFISSCSPSLADVEIMNQSSEVIKAGMIKVCGQEFSFDEIKVGNSLHFSYKISGDSDYSVEIQFQSGNKISQKAGYVTSGFPETSHRLVVFDNKIDFIVIDEPASNKANK